MTKTDNIPRTVPFNIVSVGLIRHGRSCSLRYTCPPQSKSLPSRVTSYMCWIRPFLTYSPSTLGHDSRSKRDVDDVGSTSKLERRGGQARHSAVRHQRNNPR